MGAGRSSSASAPLYSRAEVGWTGSRAAATFRSSSTSTLYVAHAVFCVGVWGEGVRARRGERQGERQVETGRDRERVSE